VSEWLNLVSVLVCERCRTGHDDVCLKCLHVDSFRSLLRLLVVFQESPSFELVEGLSKLGLCVHDDRAIPRYRFLKRLSRHQQEADAVLAALDHNLALVWPAITEGDPKRDGSS
jgi:hypothetical protein